MKAPHKHAEIIKLWADGASIQVYELDGWYDIESPRWDDEKYRIKPEPKPDVVRYGLLFLGVSEVSWTKFRTTEDNLKITFDGETRQLKYAEVLK